MPYKSTCKSITALLFWVIILFVFVQGYIIPPQKEPCPMVLYGFKVKAITTIDIFKYILNMPVAVTRPHIHFSTKCLRLDPKIHRGLFLLFD